MSKALKQNDRVHIQVDGQQWMSGDVPVVGEIVDINHLDCIQACRLKKVWDDCSITQGSRVYDVRYLGATHTLLPSHLKLA